MCEQMFRIKSLKQSQALKTALSNVLNPRRKTIQEAKMFRMSSHNFYRKKEK